MKFSYFIFMNGTFTTLLEMLLFSLNFFLEFRNFVFLCLNLVFVSWFFILYGFVFLHLINYTYYAIINWKITLIYLICVFLANWAFNLNFTWTTLEFYSIKALRAKWMTTAQNLWFITVRIKLFIANWAVDSWYFSFH